MKQILQTLLLLGLALVSTGPLSAEYKQLENAVRIGNLAGVLKELTTSSAVEGRQALAVAAGLGKLDIVNALIKAGVDVNKREGPNTALGAAAGASTGLGNLDIVNALIKAGADVNGRDEGNATALHAAASRGHLDIVKALIKAGADVNAKDLSGATALSSATLKGKWDIVNALKQAGAK